MRKSFQTARAVTTARLPTRFPARRNTSNRPRTKGIKPFASFARNIRLPLSRRECWVKKYEVYVALMRASRHKECLVLSSQTSCSSMLLSSEAPVLRSLWRLPSPPRSPSPSRRGGRRCQCVCLHVRLSRAGCGSASPLMSCRRDSFPDPPERSASAGRPLTHESEARTNTQTSDASLSKLIWIR